MSAKGYWGNPPVKNGRLILTCWMFLLHVRFESVRLLSALDIPWQVYQHLTIFHPCSHIVRIQIHLSSLLLPLMSKFHSAKMLINNYTVYFEKLWGLNTFLVTFSLSRSYTVLFLVKNVTSETSFCSRSPKRFPGLYVFLPDIPADEY